ncbi:redoxin domain-containing protein [Parafilimonas sp.]|uniref:redoxin domain-containing protein n=1 Tax=Parafilimonas sp. TaxID=1969739 RepID=UPI0039E2D30A
MRIFLAAVILCCTSLKAQLQPGYEIKTTTDFKNAKLYLGTYYGRNKRLADSAMSNADGLAVFKGSAKLPRGIYFIVSPKYVILFELLMDEKQHFSLAYDSAKPNEIKFTGSPDNELFSGYTVFLSKVSPVLNALQQQMKMAKTAADSASISKALAAKAGELTAFRNDVMKNKPASLLAKLLEVASVPERPQMPRRADGTADSLYPYYYVKGHYWDSVDFNNDMILHTPFFDSKLDDYYKYYVSPNPDSIISEVNYMLLASRGNNDVHTYLLGKFTDKYINPEYMGQDKVFLSLFENYYSKGDTAWLNEKQRKYIFDRAYSLMANQINEQASPLELTDTSGGAVSLYNIKAPLTFIAFWDPHCGHCKTQIPRLDSFYEAKWKNEGVKVLAVCTNDGVVDDWKKFIIENKLNEWYHGYETPQKKAELAANNQPDYRQLYDIFQTPTFFLLDDNKKIIAKGLSLEQYDALINAKLKSPPVSQ